MKIKILRLVIVLILVASPVWAQESGKEDLQKIITIQKETCQILKEKNMKISVFLDKILAGLDSHQLSYGAVEELRRISREAEELILKNEKKLQDVAKEKDEEILNQKLSVINNDLLLVSLHNRYLINQLLIIFRPWLKKEIAPETPI